MSFGGLERWCGVLLEGWNAELSVGTLVDHRCTDCWQLRALLTLVPRICNNVGVDVVFPESSESNETREQGTS